MDLNTITEVATPRQRSDLPTWRSGDAWLGGGTWLFSEPQPRLNRLIDLAGLGWPATTLSDDGLTIAATCTIAKLDALTLPANFIAAPLISQCCRAFLASFKIWNTATVGGNLCMALPAGPMISLTSALDGVCTIWTADGYERQIEVVDFVRGPQQNALAPGELLRAITLPAPALTKRTAFRQISLTPVGRSAALLIGTLSPRGGDFALTVTASTFRPVQITWPQAPMIEELWAKIATAIPDTLYYDDVHGAPPWRKHVTWRFAEEILNELTDTHAA